jgi:hypothetical protein
MTVHEREVSKIMNSSDILYMVCCYWLKSRR